MLDKIKQYLITSWEQIVRVSLSGAAPAVLLPMVWEGTDWFLSGVAGLTGLLVGHLKVGLR